MAHDEDYVQIVEIDTFSGVAALLKEIRKLYPTVKDNAEWESKLKQTMDLGNSCLYQYWQTQAIRLALHKEIAELNMNFPDFSKDPSTKH